MSLSIVLQAIAAVLSLTAACIAVAKRRSAHSLFFAFFALCVAVYAVGYWFEVTAPTYEAALLARNLQYLGVPFLGVLLYLFTRDYRGRPVRKGWVIALLLAIPVASLTVEAAWPTLPLYYSEVVFVASPVPHLDIVPGLGYIVCLGYTGLLSLLGLVGLVRHLMGQDPAGRRKVMVLVALLLFPLVMLVLYLFDVTGPNYTSAALTLASLVVAVYMGWFQLMEWAPAARERVIEHISDGYVFLDTDLRYMDSNAAARGFFPTLSDAKPGTPVALIQDFPLELLSGEENTTELTLGSGDSARYLRASRAAIQENDKLLGTSILMYDVTETHRLLEELAEMATLDALTGLLNRGTFFKSASRDFDLAVRNHQNAAVLMMDIDLFKLVNDQYGHLCGDQVLIAIADILRGRLRRTDIIGRYGGEEICVWLPGASLEGAQIIAEVIRRTIEQKIFYCKKTPFQITISIGVASLDADRHESVEDMIQDADTALYEAKATGRNKVCTVAPKAVEEA